MAVWDFTLIVEGRDIASEEVFDALWEAGCDDALIGQTNGVQYLDFDRDAETIEEAVASAVADTERVPGLQVVRFVDSDLVGMSEIAERCGRTRESVRLLVTGARGPGQFPPPVNDPRRPHRLWRWSEVERWLTSRAEHGDIQRGRRSTDIRNALSASIELRACNRGLDDQQRERVHQLTHA